MTGSAVAWQKGIKYPSKWAQISFYDDIKLHYYITKLVLFNKMILSKIVKFNIVYISFGFNNRMAYKEIGTEFDFKEVNPSYCYIFNF